MIIDKKIVHKLHDYFEGIELGYVDVKRQDTLSSNAENMKDTLCAVFSDRDKLLQAEFPHIPNEKDGFASSKLLALLQVHNSTSTNPSKTKMCVDLLFDYDIILVLLLTCHSINICYSYIIKEVDG